MKIIEREYYYEFEREKQVRLLYTKRSFPARSLEEIKNFQDKLATLGKEFVFLKQTHSNKVVYTNNALSEPLEGDALVTKNKNLALSTAHADCLPIYFYDLKKEIFALSHSGWRGSYSLISFNVLLKMRGLGSNFEDINVVLGPSNRVETYEVDRTFYEEFKDKFFPSLLEGSFLFKNNKIYFDNQNFNYLLIKSFTLNVFKSDICTFKNSALYSHRRGDRERNFAILLYNS